MMEVVVKLMNDVSSFKLYVECLSYKLF